MKQPHGDPHTRFIHNFVLSVLLPCILVLGDLRAVVVWEKLWSLHLIFGCVSVKYPFGFLLLHFLSIQEEEDHIRNVLLHGSMVLFISMLLD